MGDFEDVKERVNIKDFAEANLDRAKAGGRYVCPYCNSGGHGTPNSNSALGITADGQHFTCFSCGEQGDVFDLAGRLFNTDDAKERLSIVAEWAGIPIEGGFQNVWPKRRPQDSPQAPIKKKPEPEPDYSKQRAQEAAYMAQARKSISDPEATAYLEARGYSLERAQALGFGYDAKKKRLVIPWVGSDYYHIDRDITGEAKAKYLKPSSEEVGAQPFYNPSVLDLPAFYVTEGALDALAIMDAGQPATCLGGTGTTAFKDALKDAGYTGTVLIALDNDDAGADTAAGLLKDLKAAGIAAGMSGIFNSVSGVAFKDADEAHRLQGREDLSRVLRADFEKTLEQAKREQQETYRKTLEALRVVDPADIATGIFLLTDCTEPIATGIAPLDDAMDGGLYGKRLYILGATSSLGKTTLAVQMADNMAEAGKPVLFATIEQSATEIAAKSLSRMYKQANPKGYAPSATEITSRARREAWTEEMSAQLEEACSRYTSRIAPNLHILEGTKQPSVSDIATVARIIRANRGEAPVIFIDYLQLLAGKNERQTDPRIITKESITDLRQLARDMSTPVFVISSISRKAYGGSMDMDSFLESNFIEYGADVLLGLQPEGMDEKTDVGNEQKAKKAAKKATKDNKAKAVRDCEVVFLKNRNGAMHDPVPLTFYAINGLYEPAPTGGRVKSL